jgi:ATP-dependent Lon protease
LFGPYLKGASRITVTDPYIRMFYQARNFMEFCETIGRLKREDDEIKLHLSTSSDSEKFSKQENT